MKRINRINYTSTDVSSVRCHYQGAKVEVCSVLTFDLKTDDLLFLSYWIVISPLMIAGIKFKVCLAIA